MAAELQGVVGALGDPSRSFAITCFGFAQVLGQRLEKLPADDAVRLDEGAELPDREPPAHEVVDGGDRRDAHALIDQRDLAEVVAGPQRRPQLAPDRDRSIARLDQVEGRSAGALLDHRLALGERTLLEQGGDRSDLLAVELGEEADLLHHVDRCARRLAVLAAHSGDRPALEEIELPAGEGPFDVARGAVDLLAAAGQPVQIFELGIIQAELFGKLGR